MKKYLTVSYAYPIYFLLILGQYFLAEGLDAWYDAPARVPSVAQPARNLSNAPAAAPDTEKATVRTLFESRRKAVIQTLTAAKPVRAAVFNDPN